MTINATNQVVSTCRLTWEKETEGYQTYTHISQAYRELGGMLIEILSDHKTIEL